MVRAPTCLCKYKHLIILLETAEVNKREWAQNVPNAVCSCSDHGVRFSPVTPEDVVLKATYLST